MDDDGSNSSVEESETEDETTHLEHDACDIKLVEESCLILSSEFPRKVNVYLPRENNKETALSIEFLRPEIVDRGQKNLKSR